MLRLSAVLIALAAITAACADTGDNGSGTAPAPSVETGTSQADTDTAVPESTEAAPDPTTTESVPLTASFRGVTEEVIHVGVLTFDWDRLAAVGVSFGRANAGDLYVAAIEAINDRGGVHGRLIETHEAVILPVGSTEADQACVTLTEDIEIFVVVGVTLGDQVLCFTELNETAALVATGMTTERRDRALAPYATIFAQLEDRTAAFIDLMMSTGVLDGATVGVTGSVDVSEGAFTTMVEAFRAAGFDPVAGLIGGNADDLAATAREQGLIYERFVEAGVDVVVSTTGVPLEISNAIDAGYQSDQWLLSTVMTGRGLTDAGVAHDYLDGALAVVDTPIGTSGQPALADDPLAAACIDGLIERTGHPLPYSLDPEINDLAAGLIACAIASILEEALLEAGPILTNDTFQQGLESIGDIDLPGRSNVTLGPGDLGATKGLWLVRFDSATGVWEPVGPAD